MTAVDVNVERRLEVAAARIQEEGCVTWVIRLGIVL
jgi:hypothetical protein